MHPMWIETGSGLRLAIVPRPRGGDWLADEANCLRRAGVDILVSMLPTEEAAELGLADEQAACTEAGIEFRSFRIVDRQVPVSHLSLREFIEDVRRELRAGKSLAAHCRASIGRSSLLLAAILCTEGHAADEAFRRISEARGVQVPDTLEQIRWVEEFAAKL